MQFFARSIDIALRDRHPAADAESAARMRFGLGLAGSALALCIGQSNLAAEADKLEREPVESIMIEETLLNRGGEFSLRLIVDHEPSESGAIRELPGIELNLGLTDFLDVQMDVPFLYASGEPKAFGLGDIAATCKWLFLPERDHSPAFVPGTEATFPTGSVRRGLGEGNYEVAPFLAALKTFGGAVVQGNIGWSRVLASRSDKSKPRIVGAISVAVPVIKKKLYGIAEFTGSKMLQRRHWSLSTRRKRSRL